MCHQEKDCLEISLPMRDQIADILRRQILSGKLKSGDKISERDISSFYNVSTAPVKEAIRTLNMEGLLRTFPRKGTYVSSFVGDNILQMIHLRSVIEGTAAFWGTKNISKKDIEKMETYLERFKYLLYEEDIENKEVLDQIAKNNYHFHLLLSNAAQNDYLDQLIKNLGSINNTIRYMYYLSDIPSDYEVSLRDHTEILNAVKERCPEDAEALTIKHIKRVGDTVLALQNKE